MSEPTTGDAPTTFRASWDGERPGRIIVGVNLIGTALFTATAIIAAVFFTTPLQWVGAITAMTLFAAGVVTFLWSYYNAVQRSRYEQISVLEVYLLTGTVAPRWVRWRMWIAMAVQVGVALATALSRPDGPDGRPGSSLAVGILAPMLGFGLNGMWAAFHGRFPSHDELGRSQRTATQRAPDDDAAYDDDAPEVDDVTGEHAGDADAAGDEGLGVRGIDDAVDDDDSERTGGNGMPATDASFDKNAGHG